MKKFFLLFCFVLLYDNIFGAYVNINLWYNSYAINNPGMFCDIQSVLHCRGSCLIQWHSFAEQYPRLYKLSDKLFFMFYISEAGKTVWQCRKGTQTNIARIEIAETPAPFRACRCSLRSVSGSSNEVLNIEGFRHQFASGAYIKLE